MGPANAFRADFSNTQGFHQIETIFEYVMKKILSRKLQSFCVYIPVAMAFKSLSTYAALFVKVSSVSTPYKL